MKETSDFNRIMKTHILRKIFASVFVVFLTASLAAAIQQTDKWITYTSPEGRYSISLPVQPALKTQESTSADGEKFPQFIAVASDADIVFLVGYFDVSPGSNFSVDLALDAMVQKVSGKIVSENPINLGTYPGRDVNVAMKLNVPSTEGEPSSQTDYIDHLRMYEAGKRVYILQALFPKALESEAVARVTKYFDSFQVKN
jgi:hypothetical protein